MAGRNEHLVVVMVEPPPSDEFIEWPLHITIVPWFHADNEDKLDTVLSEVASKQKSFEVVVGKKEFFGHKKDLAVNVLEDQTIMHKLHWSTLQALENNGFSIHQKDFTGPKYRAHITQQPHGYMSPGDRLKIKSITLVKQVRQKKTGTMIKSVVKEFTLHE